jgi:hypothetical protein
MTGKNFHLFSQYGRAFTLLVSYHWLHGFLPNPSPCLPRFHWSLGGKLIRPIRTYPGVPVLLAVVGLPAHATQFASKTQFGILRLPMEWNQFTQERQLACFSNLSIPNGAPFFRVVDLSSRAIRGEYGMSSQIGYKVIAALRYIFLRTNNQECFTITLGFRVQQGCPLYLDIPRYMRYPLIRGDLRSAILRWLRPTGLRTAFEASAAEPLCRYEGNLAALGRKPAHANYCVSIYLYPVRINWRTTALPVRDRIGCARPGKISVARSSFAGYSIVWVQVIFWIKPIGEWMGRPVTGRVCLWALMGKLVVGRQRGVPPCVAHSIAQRHGAPRTPLSGGFRSEVSCPGRSIIATN